MYNILANRPNPDKKKTKKKSKEKQLSSGDYLNAIEIDDNVGNLPTTDCGWPFNKGFSEEVDSQVVVPAQGRSELPSKLDLVKSNKRK
mmetsp:Transcript_1449/g.1686  ORF Transcript_1449/g.1686 Transcript_1449/m.1686 type:complete len:88 (-) Transcript_1449:673-936(-)